MGSSRGNTTTVWGLCGVLFGFLRDADTYLQGAADELENDHPEVDMHRNTSRRLRAELELMTFRLHDEWLEFVAQNGEYEVAKGFADETVSVLKVHVACGLFFNHISVIIYISLECACACVCAHVFKWRALFFFTDGMCFIRSAYSPRTSAPRTCWRSSRKSRRVVSAPARSCTIARVCTSSASRPPAPRSLLATRSSRPTRLPSRY